MRHVGMLLLVCLVTLGCSLGRSQTDAPWPNPPLAEKPPLDYQIGSRGRDGSERLPGVVIFSTKDEGAIDNIAVAFTAEAWNRFSAWVSQTYEDGKVRWRVLEEANKR